ncbi:MAG: hypothetical protein IH859_06920 [Chloroflexi bacterium]|nr:hypothetical protein [Chloroflexota bacterium]
MNLIKSTLLLALLSLVAAACVQPAPAVLSPEDAITQAALDPTEIVIFPSQTPVQQSNASIPSANAPTNTQAPPSSTTTSIPANTQISGDEGTATATDVPATSTVDPEFTPSPTFVAFSPDAAYGPPQINELFLSEDSWVGPGGSLPDNENIRIEVVDQEMRVTGKNLLFDTWYFSWPTLDEFYIEMLVDSAQCTGKDSYGLIFRGSASGTPSHGYVVSFSCDGSYRVLRIDFGDPYNFTELISWSSNQFIHAGPNQLNILGVRGDGESFTIFANGQQIATFIDDWYSIGRYGVFINSGNTAAYTYRTQQIRVWRYLD